MQRKLSWKLAAVVTLGIAVVHGVFGYLRVERELTELESEAARYHGAMAHVLSLAATATAERAGADEARRLLAHASRGTPHAEITWRPALPSPVPPPAGATAQVRSAFEEAPDRITLVSTAPLSLGDTHGTLEIREPLTAEQAFLHGTVTRIALMTLVLVVLCSAILFAAGWFFLDRPIEALMGKVRRIGSGDLSGPLSLRQRDELGTLGKALDEMCDQLADLRTRSDEEASGKIAALEQLRHADRLTTVGKLASGLAHELGTPLNVVAARARMVARRHSEGEEAVQDAEVIVGQAERMTQIIRQLLDFARLRKPARSREALDELCQQAIGMLAPLARKADVSLELSPGAETVTAEVDAAQLQQVLSNLIMNAIQAQPDGGVVRVRVLGTADAPPARSEALAGPHLSIVVEDAGPGMSEEVRQRLFEPFFTTKDIGEGTGLGLSVAYGIISEHGGCIDVEPIDGGGTRFTVHLPEATP